jgi:hypothetical protein
MELHSRGDVVQHFREVYIVPRKWSSLLKLKERIRERPYLHRAGQEPPRNLIDVAPYD